MRFFFAGSDKEKFLAIIRKKQVNNLLFSYYWLGDKSLLKKMKEEGKDVFIDSGGYSARKQGIEVNIKEYGWFLEDYKDYIFCAANLDVMDLKQSQENQEYLEKIYPVLPVYHMLEWQQKKYDLLEDMCQKYKYIALGGMAGMSVNQNEMINFLNFCFQTIVKYNIKVHGFGISKVDLLVRYPFYSCDSTAWLVGGQYGTIVNWKKYKMDQNTHVSRKGKFYEFKLPTKLTENYIYRLEHNVEQFLQMEKDITALWEKRGILWKD